MSRLGNKVTTSQSKEFFDAMSQVIAIYSECVAHEEMLGMLAHIAGQIAAHSCTCGRADCENLKEGREIISRNVELAIQTHLRPPTETRQ